MLQEDELPNNGKVSDPHRAAVTNPRRSGIAEPVTLALALARSEQVQAKVEACADDLASANDVVKTKIAEGATTVAANTALAITEKVESKVRESADDLHEVNESLAQELNDLNHTEIALTESRAALADTEATLATARLRALHDSVTTLPNRDLFNDRLTHAIAMAGRHGWTLAVMFLDLDGFKTINDTHGHSAGDGVLKEVAKRLLEHSREEDTVCRNGGDEFLYLLVDPQGTENVKRIANKVLMNIEQPIAIDDQQLVIGASIGIAVYPDHGTTGEQLIRNADTAMYRAKKQMGGSVAIFGMESKTSIDTQELVQSEERFRLLVESVRDYAIFMLDPNGVVLTWNAGAQRFKGYRADEIIGQHFSRFYPPEALARGLPDHELEVATDTGVFEDEGWRVRKDGTLFWANVVITAVRNADGQLLGFAKVTRDLTQRHAHEQELRRSEERFRLLVEGVREYAIFMLDTNGRVTTWNSGAERIKGYTASEIIGQHFSIFYPTDLRESGWPEHELQAAAESGSFVDNGWRLRKDGTMFWANVTITALRDDTGQLLGYAKLTRNVTETKRVEAPQPKPH
jgi:diguanylate cyclase (GGDEF)-like protein/PAS domain S-box-containing protein